MYIKQLILIATSLIIINGCSLFSQNRSTSPNFDGVLNFRNIPINNAKIILSLKENDTQCLKAKTFTYSNEQGRFSIKATLENYNYTPFLNYSFDEWTICANYNGHTYTLYTNNRYDSGNVTGSVFLECDLALKPVNKLCSASH